MVTYYAKRALEILREEGAVELFKKSTRYILRQPLELLDPQYHRRFKFHTWKNHLQNRIRYDAPPEPYRTIEIKPRNIQFRIWYKKDGIPITNDKRGGLAQIKAGSWDKSRFCEDVEKLWQVKGLKERFVEEKSWTETAYYNHLTSNRKVSKEEVMKRCNFYDRLFKSIDKNGYEVGHVGENFSGTFSSREKLEVLITIGRNGEIYLWDGHHRFTIGRLLDLKIPAHVVCRHKQWQELRDEIHNNGLPEGREDLRDHPDLQDVLN